MDRQHRSRQKTRRRVLQLAAMYCLAPAIPRWGWSAPPDLSGHTMGGTFRVRIGDDLPIGSLPRLRRRIIRTLDDVDRRLSLYRPHSELSRLNRQPSGEPLAMHPDSVELLQSALEIRRLGGNAYNPFAAPLVERWGFGPALRMDKGNLAADASALRRIREASLTFDGDRVSRTHDGTALDLNGIAKGDAVDRVADVLTSHGITGFMVEVGGEIRCRSGGDFPGWQIGIEGPAGEITSRVRLVDAAVATSGDFLHYYLHNGRRYSHLVDPRSGVPVRHDLALVSVVAATARMADAWSTTLMVMGPDAGYEFALENDLAALFIRRDPAGPSIRRTPAFHRLELVA
jgi:thiamine biosynthesis lipoprotein